MDSIFAQVLTKGMAIIAIAAISLMYAIGMIKIKSKRINKSKIWKDWGSFILLSVCIGLTFLPGLELEKLQGQGWGAKIIFALVVTMVAHLGRKILKPIILKKIEGKK